MYITSATFGLTADALAGSPSAGAIFQVERETPGRPANIFGGRPWGS
jgi:hypothetical protein